LFHAAPQHVPTKQAAFSGQHHHAHLGAGPFRDDFGYKMRLVPLFPVSLNFFIFCLSSRLQLSSDPFMKQVSYAADIVSELTNDDFAEERLVAQLSHSDGIRGFFVTHLTGEGQTAADNDIVPTPLQCAMKQVNQDELISLACTYTYCIILSSCLFLFNASFLSLMVRAFLTAGMNVVMPTATSSMHTDSELAAASQKTAERGMRVLTSLLDNPITKQNCAAIYAASSGKQVNADSDLVKVSTRKTLWWAYVTIVMSSHLDDILL
jgi:hypothetical protein